MRDEAFYDINSCMRPRAGKGVTYSSGENKIVRLLSPFAAKFESMDRPYSFLLAPFSILFSYCIPHTNKSYHPLIFFPSKIRKMRLIKMTLDTE